MEDLSRIDIQEGLTDEELFWLERQERFRMFMAAKKRDFEELEAERNQLQEALHKSDEIINEKDKEIALLKKKLARESSAANLNDVKMKKGAEAENARRALAAANELADKLGGKSFTVKAKGGEGGKLYGAVTNADISDVLKADGFDIEKKQVVIKDAIKNVGTYGVRIKLHPKVSCEINVNVEAG